MVGGEVLLVLGSWLEQDSMKAMSMLSPITSNQQQLTQAAQPRRKHHDHR